MRPETKLGHEFVTELIRQLDDNYPHHIFRIESNLTQQGIPDIYCCINGFSFWVELKVDIDLSPLQHSWLEQHRLAGGRTFVVYQMHDHYHVMTADKDGEVQKDTNTLAEVVDYIHWVIEDDVAKGFNSGEEDSGDDA